MPPRTNAGRAASTGVGPSHTLPASMALHPSAVQSASPADPLSALVEAAVDRVLERRWDELLEAARAPSPPQLRDSAWMRQWLDVSDPKLRSLVAEGMPVIRLGEVRRFDVEAVRQWLASRGAK